MNNPIINLQMELEINRIYNENNLETMSRMPDNFVDCIVTSPPYNKKSVKRNPKGNTVWSGGNVAIKYADFYDDMDEETYQEWQVQFLNECMRILKPFGSMFYNHKNRTIDKGIISPYEWIVKSNAILKEEIIWDRQMIVEIDKVRFYPKTEKIFWLTKSRIQPKFNGEFAKFTDIWAFPPTQREDRHNHPAPFPIDLPARCIKATTQEGDLVYDPFMGSGTTAVAALKYGRNFIGSELTSEYIKTAKDRLTPLLKQKSLF